MVLCSQNSPRDPKKHICLGYQALPPPPRKKTNLLPQLTHTFLIVNFKIARELICYLQCSNFFRQMTSLNPKIFHSNLLVRHFNLQILHLSFQIIHYNIVIFQQQLQVNLVSYFRKSLVLPFPLST